MKIALEDVEVWAFDLDNTLYPPECDFFAQIDVRMGRFIAELLGIEPHEARKVQKELFASHGTTLRGLMDYHHIEPTEFLDYVHNIDLSPVPPNPLLGRAIAALPGRKYVFTNADRAYAERVMARLEVTPAFDGIFDIEAAGYHPKPRGEAYDRFLERFDVDPHRAVMVEDMAKNLTPAHERGMRTVWVPTGTDWSSAGAQADHIDHTIDDLTEWVCGLAGLAD